MAHAEVERYVSSKTEAASHVRQVLQSVKDRLSQPGGARVNEATTRAHFLNPLFEALGYSSIDDVLFEYYLPDGKTFLDYRLVVAGKPRVAVEAKALEVTLTDQHAAQAVSYAAILGDEWAVLTNAREWRLYHAFAQAPLADKLILKVDLVSWESDAQFEAVFEQLWLISRDSFEAGDGPGSWLASKNLDRTIRHVLTDPASAEVKYLRGKLEQRGISVSADVIAAWFKSHIDVAGSTSRTPRASAPYPPAGSGSTSAPSHDKKEEYAIKPAGAGGYWIIPAGKQHGFSAADHLRAWLSRGFWGFGPSAPGRKAIKPGDWVCFYAAQSHEVLAYGRISAALDQPVQANEWPGPDPQYGTVYKVPLSDIAWLAKPIVLDAPLRGKLDAYQGKDPGAGWSWLVQTSHRISEGDFKRLTGRA